VAQKITISVSDELHEKIQQYKDSFNYSKIFQDIISKEFQKKEDEKIREQENRVYGLMSAFVD